MTEIAVYVEGGGDRAALKEELRRGFDALFEKERSKTREKRGGLKFVCCGGRDEAYKAFKNALKFNSERINALLVDSETAIASVAANKREDARIRVAHLNQVEGTGAGGQLQPPDVHRRRRLKRKESTGARGQGDGWDLPDDLAEQVHLMVQCMEAWIVADPDALERFYKQDFKRNRLPKRSNLEEESKADIYASLEGATEGTQKGKYAKIRHASQLLAVIDPGKIAERCPRFSIFQKWIVSMI